MEWVCALDKCSVPVGPIYHMDEMFADPQVKHSGFTQKVQHSKRGEISLIGQPVALSRTPAQISIASPDAGEHSDLILTELGYNAAQIGHLREGNIV